jgi:autophagy-related protein 17
MRLPSPTWTLWSTTLLLSPATALNRPLRARQPDTNFDWTAITPTPDLQYHPCYGTFQCARLQVPLDWSKANTTANRGPHAAIAIVTLPATVPPTDPAYAGPILINPGGPGGSGTEMALGLAAVMQSLVDVPGVRHYDILGFDPRGVALTTPSASCFASQFDRAADGMYRDGMSSVLDEQGLKMRFELAKGVAGLCALAQPGEESVFRYVSTASVARDMLEIVERVHALNTKGNATVAGKACGGGSGGKPKLQYFGMSYGSFLANTFASMFPDRIGRIVVDGVVDADDYVSGVSDRLGLSGGADEIIADGS